MGARRGIIVPMASRIEAIVYDGHARPPSLPADWRTVSLSGGLTMVPITDDLASRLDQAAPGDRRIGASWLMRQPVAALARQISADRRALYIAGETFAGDGACEAIGWQDGRLLYGPSRTCDREADLEPGYHLAARRDSAINAGLRALGVRAGPGHDEYEGIGLARRRFTEDWIDE